MGRNLLGVGTGSPGTFLQAAVLNDGLDARRNAMLHLFLTPSPLLVAGEALVGISLPMFVAALIAAYGDRIRLSAGRWARTDLCAPDPETGPPRGSYAVPAPHLAPTSARLPLESARNFAQHLSWKT